MKFHKQTIPNVYLIEPEPFVDDRGAFRRHFCEKEFKDHGIDCNVKQCNVSENKFKHTLRGFHHQLAPYGESKTLSCILGAMYDVIVDLREDSPTYLRWLAFEINEENRCSVHVPTGCANAFFTLSDTALIHYYCSESYHADHERGIRYNDPLFKFEWPAEPQVISEKDKSWPDFVPSEKASLT